MQVSNDSRAIIRSSAVIPNEKGGSKTVSSFLTIFRNQQGVFLPAMSDNEGPSYWRIEKAQSDPDIQDIKDGDAIRLCWCFSDQTSGYRDFFDDSFGRRRVIQPAGVPDKLYLKVPFPRFESITVPAGTEPPGISLIMSGDSEHRPILESIQTLPEKPGLGHDTEAIKYNLHDLVLRIDSVG